MKIEPVSKPQLAALARTLGGLQAAVLRLHDVDLSKGRGVPDDGGPNFTCYLWTHDRHRITITTCLDGALIGSVGKEPDVECPIHEEEAAK